MAFQVSPGVNVSEIDLTNIIPAVSTSIGGTVGTFTWGPTDTPTLISSEEQLASIFGEPFSNSTWTNQESFFSAANFLSYSNALYVSRIQGGSSNNASTSSTTLQIGNREEYDAGADTYSDEEFFAKYPGSRGNNLAISVCPSAAAYNSTVNLATAGNIADANTDLEAAAVANAQYVVGANTFTINFDDEDATDANTTTEALTTILGKFSNNDYIKVEGNFYKITGIGSASADANTAVASATINIDRNFKGTANVSATTIERYWEFYNTVERAPQNSKFAADNGSSVVDEVHVVVYDSTGDLTGTKRTALEVFEGLSRATNAKSENGTDINLTTAINNRSAWLWRGGADITNSAEAAVGSVAASTATLPITYQLSNGTDSNTDGNTVIAEAASGWDKFKATDLYDLSLIVTGKADATLANYIIDNIADVRKDCMVFISPEKTDVVSSNQPISSSSATTNVINFRNQLNNTSYAAIDSGYKYQYDKYNDAYVWVPLNGDIAGLCARTDDERDPWFSPAGFARGTIKNVVKLAYVPSKAERDELYKADINPVVTFPGQGTVLYGDKTLLGRASAFDRINVRRLFITLEKSISTAANSLLFEFNDAITRAQFRNAVVPFLREVQGRRGITDFSVIADETNNTAEVVDANQFVGDIYIKPARSINFIQLNFVAVRSGVEFSEIVGTA